MTYFRCSLATFLAPPLHWEMATTKSTRSAATKLVIIFAVNGGESPVNDSAVITSFVADGENFIFLEFGDCAL